jgi:hypothetical protein
MLLVLPEETPRVPTLVTARPPKRRVASKARAKK